MQLLTFLSIIFGCITLMVATTVTVPPPPPEATPTKSKVVVTTEPSVEVLQTQTQTRTKMKDATLGTEDMRRDKRQLLDLVYYDNGVGGVPNNQPGAGAPGLLPNLPIIGTLVGNLPLLQNGQQGGGLLTGIPILGNLVGGLGSLGPLNGLGNLIGLGGGTGTGTGGGISVPPQSTGTGVASCPISQKLTCRCEPLIPIKPLGTRQQKVEIVKQSTRHNDDGTKELRLVLSNGLISYQRTGEKQLHDSKESVVTQGYFALQYTNGRYFNIYYTINDFDYTVKADVTNGPPTSDFDEGFSGTV